LKVGFNNYHTKKKNRTTTLLNHKMSDTTMTPEQFFDQLDEIFDCVDGYINHLQRIKELKEENERLEAIVKSDSGTMKLYGHIVSLMEKNTELQEENVKLKGEKEILDMRTGDGWYLAKLIEPECIALHEENKKLKEENDRRKSLCEHYEMLNKKHYDELQKLKTTD
jgi:hypothetical protein